jgi:hypothetical protein
MRQRIYANHPTTSKGKILATETAFKASKIVPGPLLSTSHGFSLSDITQALYSP